MPYDEESQREAREDRLEAAPVPEPPGQDKRSPRGGEKPPGPKHVHYPPIEEGLEEETDPDDPGDVGGGFYRPRTRLQDPASDPYEPWHGAGPDDTAARGYTHGWNNCLMTSGAVGLDYHTGGNRRYWGGHMRHHQEDMAGGTDLSDLKVAWSRFGFTLSVRSGQGWDAVVAARKERRGIILQGRGNCPGAGTYTGAHAIYINPEARTNSAGVRQWLIMDPLVAGWQWASVASIKQWCERLNPRVQFAVTRSR